MKLCNANHDQREKFGWKEKQSESKLNFERRSQIVVCFSTFHSSCMVYILNAMQKFFVTRRVFDVLTL